MRIFDISNRNFFYLSILLFLLIRLFLQQKGILSKDFDNFYQIVNLNILREDFLGSIYYFHYQPPFWNTFIGSIVKILGPQYVFAKHILVYMHWLFSIGMMYIIYNLSIKLNLDKKIFIAGLSLIIFNPSLIFYENFPLYNHFSCFIFFLLFFNFYLLFETNKRKYEYTLFSLLLILTLTWPLFHPIFILFVFCLITYSKKKFSIKSLIISIIFFLISLSPSIKNKIEFDLFANGSGLGKNMSVLVFWNKDLERQCNYSNLSQVYVGNKKPKHPILLIENHVQNSLQALDKSKYCLKYSIDEIQNNFSNYLLYRFRVLLASHNRFSFEYFQPPIKFNDYFDIFKNLKKNDFLWKIKKIFINLFFMIYYLILLNYFFRIEDKKSFKKASICIFMMHLYILSVGTLINNQEQERFRYTSGIYLNFLFFYILLKYRLRSILVIK